MDNGGNDSGDADGGGGGGGSRDDGGGVGYSSSVLAIDTLKSKLAKK